MTVQDLIRQLQNVAPDTLIVMSRDSEGNGYSPLYEIDDSSSYLADSTWSGEIALRELTDELRAKGYTDEDAAGPDHVPCVVLWPTN